MFSETTAILVDGAFYRRRSYYLLNPPLLVVGS